MVDVAGKYDVAVIGAGHAGIEAALASARLGCKTAVFTINMDAVGNCPCNPSIGGTAKGHLVRELDALGGEMGKAADETFLQMRMLNRGKGPAVHSLRAQIDRRAYAERMKHCLELQQNLELRQAEITDLVKNDDGEWELTTRLKTKYLAKAVVIATGTYLGGIVFVGDVSYESGPDGIFPSKFLPDALKNMGMSIRRFKTGTPARVDKRTVDFTKMEEQFGDERVVPFSFTTDPDSIQKEQVSCWLTYTNEETHKIIKENIERSPLFSGMIEGTGPRYCPSIEDKVVKFADKNRHQVFIEPEGLYTNEMYLGGMSSSLPEDVQYAMYHTVPGLENAKIVRNAYAIEYDCIEYGQLLPNLEFKNIKGLFSAGQFNGSSGYEEAAAQGIIAGINAARFVQGKESVILDRSQAYIGVLIDDLVTKESHEPYRMMTSRAEYRLLLRQDNADLRLTKIGYEVGLISKERYHYVCEKEKLIEKEVARLEKCKIGAAKENQDVLEKLGTTPLKTATTLGELIRRPELDYDMLKELDKDRVQLPYDVTEQVNINIKYNGYIERQKKQVKNFKKLENKKIPENFDYSKVKSLRIEAAQKLDFYKPVNIGQASRISGVSPADISVLLIYMEQMKNK